MAAHGLPQRLARQSQSLAAGRKRIRASLSETARLARKAHAEAVKAAAAAAAGDRGPAAGD
jgi:hypothetical protein